MPAPENALRAKQCAVLPHGVRLLATGTASVVSWHLSGRGLIPLHSRGFFMAEKPKQRYVSQADAAVHLGVTPRTIRQMIADGRLCGYRSGSRLVRLRLDELDSVLQPFGGAVAAESRSTATSSPPGGRKPRTSRSGADA